MRQIPQFFFLVLRQCHTIDQSIICRQVIKNLVIRITKGHFRSTNQARKCLYFDMVSCLGGYGFCIGFILGTIFIRMKKQTNPSGLQLPSPSPNKNKARIPTFTEAQRVGHHQSAEHANGTSLPKIKNKQPLQRYAKGLNKSTTVKNSSKSEISFEDKYGWVGKQIEYASKSDEEIKEENLRLRAALKKIDQEVDNLMTSVQTKIEKNINKIKILENPSRVKQDGSTFSLFHNDVEHRKEVQAREAINNQFQLKMCRKEYIRLKKREKYIVGESESTAEVKSNTVAMVIAHSRCKERLQTSIDETIGTINKTKELNKKIKYRNKTLGESIHGTDQFIQNMKRLQFQVEFQTKNKLKLQKKLRQCQDSLSEVARKIFQLKSKSDVAEQYIQQSTKKQKNEEEIKNLEQNLKKKQNMKQLIDRKKELQIHNNQITYHNLLQSFDHINECIKKTATQIQAIESENTGLKDQIRNLENKLEKLRLLKKSAANETKINLMILSNGLEDTENDVKSQYSIMMKDSEFPQKQSEKKATNYMTGTIQKSKNQAAESQTEPQIGKPEENSRQLEQLE